MDDSHVVQVVQSSMTPRPDQLPARRWVHWHLALIAAAGTLVYANTFGNGFVWDDHTLIVGNPAIKNWHGFWALWSSDLFPPLFASHYYRPLQTLTYFVDYRVWALAPFGYHLTNTALHIGVALLFYRLVVILTATPRAALIGALFFVVHPLNTEAATYISARADVLSAFFLMLAIVCFCNAEEEERRFGAWGVASLTAFAAALFARETAVVLLPLAWLVESALRRRGAVRTSPVGRPWLRYLPYVVVIALYAGVHAAVVGTATVTTSVAEVALPWRVATMLGVIARYVGLLLVPIHLHMERTVAPASTLWAPGRLGASILVVGGITLAVMCRHRAWQVSFGIAWFLLALLPFCNLIPLATFMAEHWVYVPSLGFFFVAGWGLDRMLDVSRGVALPLLILGALVANGWLTIRRNRDWKDDLAIFEATLREAPDSLSGREGLAEAYRRSGELERAEAAFRDVVALDAPNTTLTHAIAHNNLGLVLRDLGRPDEGAREFETAIHLDPNYSDAYGNLGNYLSRRGRTAEALDAYRAALRFDPNSAKAHNNLGTLHYQMGHRDLAEQEIRRALELDPDLDDARRNLAMIINRRANAALAPQ